VRVEAATAAMVMSAPKQERKPLIKDSDHLLSLRTQIYLLFLPFQQQLQAPQFSPTCQVKTLEIEQVSFPFGKPRPFELGDTFRDRLHEGELC
jgi:hypothetical protein